MDWAPIGAQSQRQPSETMDMLSCIIADEPTYAPHDLSQVLETIDDAYPILPVDAGFSRLADIVAQR